MKHILFVIFLATIFFINLIACDLSDSEQSITLSESVESMENTNYKIPVDCDFNVIDHAYSKNTCSPYIIKPAYEGVLINVSKKITFNENMEVLLACTFSFSNKTDLGVFEGVANSIVFTVIDTASHGPYSGKVPGMQNSIPPPPMPNHSGNQTKIDPEERPLQYRRGYVNVNLLNIVNMPKKVGHYIVYATISTYKSNVIEFDIVNPK